MNTALKQALRARRPTLGSWITFPSEATTEIMLRGGFDWLVLDMEHSPIDIAEAARLIRVIDLAGVSALCRLPSNDPVLAKRVLEAGASGIVVPTVESAEEARKAVASAYYPPKGKRGVGLSRAQGYGQTFDQYRSTIDDWMVVVVMIETAAGVQDVDAIAKTPGIDALLVGPYDLSASLGCIGQLDHPSVAGASQKVSDAARGAGISSGWHIVHFDAATLDRTLAAGHTFLAIGVDMIFLGDTVTRTMKSVRTSLDARTVRT